MTALGCLIFTSIDFLRFPKWYLRNIEPENGTDISWKNPTIIEFEKCKLFKRNFQKFWKKN